MGNTKTEAGWDDLSSSKYRAYLHTLAIDALAVWVVARVKLKMRPRQVSVEVIQEQLGGASSSGVVLCRDS